jgi:hypothetical protein
MRPDVFHARCTFMKGRISRLEELDGFVPCMPWPAITEANRLPLVLYGHAEDDSWSLIGSHAWDPCSVGCAGCYLPGVHRAAGPRCDTRRQPVVAAARHSLRRRGHYRRLSEWRSAGGPRPAEFRRRCQTDRHCLGRAA